MGTTLRRPHLLRCLMMAIALSASARAHAEPIAINVGSTSYTTTLENQTVDPLTETSTDPITGATLYATDASLGTYLAAAADATMFGVDVYSAAAAFSGSQASALSVIEFSPTSTGTGSLGIAIDGGRHDRLYSIESIALFDLTAGEQVWTYGACGFSCTLADFSSDTTLLDLETGSLIFSQSFDASHLYRLSIYSVTFAAGDSERIRTTLSGLVAVPEPSTLLLICMGILTTVAWHQSAHRSLR